MKLLELQRRDENDEIQGSIEDLNQDITGLNTKVTKPKKNTTKPNLPSELKAPGLHSMKWREK